MPEAPLLCFGIHWDTRSRMSIEDPVYIRGGISRSGQSGCRLRVQHFLKVDVCIRAFKGSLQSSILQSQQLAGISAISVT